MAAAGADVEAEGGVTEEAFAKVESDAGLGLVLGLALGLYIGIAAKTGFGGRFGEGASVLFVTGVSGIGPGRG